MNTIAIDPSQPLGPIKPMNAVNNGPLVARKDQTPLSAALVEW